MSRLRVLHLAPFLQGGAGRAIVDLARAQQRHGHQVTVVASKTGEAGYGNYAEYIDRLDEAGATVWLQDSLFKRDLPLNLQVLELLRRRVHADAVDLLHAHAAVPALVGRLFAGHGSRRIPLLQTQHGWGTSKTSAQTAADLAILRDVDRVIATSEATRDFLIGLGIPASSIVVIPCGLPADEAGAPPEEAVRLLQPLRARGARIVGCIGSVTANKNQRLLIEALSQLGDRGRATGDSHALSAVVVFIGEGGEALRAHAEAAGVADRVIVCGYQAHAARWLPLMDVLVLPSNSEGQGLAVLEAFRVGVPVVASDIPALAELVRNGQTGLLFGAGNAAALAGALRTAIALPEPQRQAIAAAARGRFLKAFTVDRMVARHEELYAAVTAAEASALRMPADC